MVSDSKSHLKEVLAFQSQRKFHGSSSSISGFLIAYDIIILGPAAKVEGVHPGLHHDNGSLIAAYGLQIWRNHIICTALLKIFAQTNSFLCTVKQSFLCICKKFVCTSTQYLKFSVEL